MHCRIPTLVSCFFLGLAALAANAQMGLRSDGLLFPDGSVQTTAGGPRAYYLSSTLVAATSAPTACAPGFHMASLFEIFDVSNLRYATEEPDALTDDDTGQGPPSGASGWIRTGGPSVSSSAPGYANCLAWTSSSGSERGSTVWLFALWNQTTATGLEPWVADTWACNNTMRVWCVQDLS